MPPPLLIIETPGLTNDVVYQKDPLATTEGIYIALNDGSTETILATNAYDLSAPIYAISYAINAGWTAFTSLGPSGVTQVWTRSPSGVRQQRTFFGTTSGVVALAPDGGLIFQNNGRLYMDQGNLAPLDLGAWNYAFTTDSGANVFHQTGQWYLQLGRSLFQVYHPLSLSANLTMNGQMKIDVVAKDGDQVIIQTAHGSHKLVKHGDKHAERHKCLRNYRRFGNYNSG